LDTSVTFKFIPTSADCAECGEPIGYGVKVNTLGGQENEFGGRSGPASFNEECVNSSERA
jgi:hypothetical protein